MNEAVPTLSVIVPMFNEEPAIQPFFERIKRVLDALGEPYEIICVNDGSTDQTSELVLAKRKLDHRIKIINLSRNFGKELALSAGLDMAVGNAVIPIDADLQDPPELIGEFLRYWREGYDVVIGVRSNRESDSWLKRNSASYFYALINRLSRIEITANAGDFRLMDRRVVIELRRLRERNRFMKGLFAWVGYKTKYVPYTRPERVAGTSRFNYWRLWNFALDGITAHSTVPLRIAGYLGIFSASIAMLYGIYLIFRTVIFGADLPGYASIMVAIIFMGGAQLTVLGIIGEYIGRIFEETKRRPLYIVESQFGFNGRHDRPANEERKALESDND